MIRLFRHLPVLLLILLLGACGSERTVAPVPQGSSVLAIGDSVTFGTGAEAGRSYPQQLAQETGWHIHNYGIPGDTSAGVRDRVDAALAETGPALVLLEIGGNDFIRRVSAAEVQENIRATIRQIKAQGIPVVLIAVPQFSPLGVVFGQLPDAPLYAELAAEEAVALIPGVFAEVLADNRLKSDTIHPNGEGYAVMARGVREALGELGYFIPQK